MTRSQEKLFIGIFFAVMGLAILSAAFGFGPMSDSAMHAPRWVIGASGLIFLSSAFILVEKAHTLSSLLAGIVTVGMTLVCGWIAIFGEDEYFSGGLSLFSDRVEVLIARVLFGLVAGLGAAITINAIRKTLGRRRT